MRGNFGNTEQHRKAGKLSKGNRGNSEQHRIAGKLGAQARIKNRELEKRWKAAEQEGGGNAKP